MHLISLLKRFNLDENQISNIFSFPSQKSPRKLLEWLFIVLYTFCTAVQNVLEEIEFYLPMLKRGDLTHNI